MKKIAPFFSFLIVLVTSCSIDATDIATERDENQNAPEPTFMSGVVNEVPYSNLKPQNYTGVASLQTDVETYQKTPVLAYNYLLLQGSDITLMDAPLPSSVLINIRIPESKWAVGTYALNDVENTGINGTDCFAGLIEIGSGNKTRIVSGTLNITEFNLVTRTIKGTFSFSYMRKVGTTLEGPYELNSGAFKYKLDAPYFNQ
jgi:hypothetical protein